MISKWWKMLDESILAEADAETRLSRDEHKVMTPEQLKRRIKVLLARKHMDIKFTFIPSACLGASDFRCIHRAACEINEIGEQLGIDPQVEFKEVVEAMDAELNLYYEERFDTLLEQGFIDEELYQEFVEFGGLRPGHCGRRLPPLEEEHQQTIERELHEREAAEAERKAGEAEQEQKPHEGKSIKQLVEDAMKNL